MQPRGGPTEMGVCWSVTLPPGSVEQFDLRQPFADHGGEEKGEEDAADQHVVVVVLQHVKLLGGINPRLEDVQTVSHHLQGKSVQVQTYIQPIHIHCSKESRQHNNDE